MIDIGPLTNNNYQQGYSGLRPLVLKVVAILRLENPGLTAFLNELQGKRDSLNRGPKVRAGGGANRSNL